MTDMRSKDTFQIPNSDRIAPSGTISFTPEGERIDFRKADPEFMSVAELNRAAQDLAKSKDAPMQFQIERIEFGGTVLTLAAREQVSSLEDEASTLLEVARQHSAMVVAYRSAEGTGVDLPQEQ